MNLMGKIQYINNITLKEYGLKFNMSNELIKEIVDIIQNEHPERSDTSCEGASEKKEKIII